MIKKNKLEIHGDTGHGCGSNMSTAFGDEKKDIQEVFLKGRKLFAKLVHTEEECIGFFRNVEDGLDFLLNCIDGKKGDTILLPETTYRSIPLVCTSSMDCTNSAQEDNGITYTPVEHRELPSVQKKQKKRGYRVETVSLDENTTTDGMIQSFLSALSKNPGTTCIILPQVTRFGLHTDIRAVSRGIKAVYPNVFILIDGAQALGNLDSEETRFDTMEQAGIDACIFAPNKHLNIGIPLGVVCMGEKIKANIEKGNIQQENMQLLPNMIVQNIQPTTSVSLNPVRVSCLIRTIENMLKEELIQEKDGYFRFDTNKIKEIKQEFLNLFDDEEIKEFLKEEESSLQILRGSKDGSSQITSFRSTIIKNEYLWKKINKIGVECSYIKETDSIRFSFGINSRVNSEDIKKIIPLIKAIHTNELAKGHTKMKNNVKNTLFVGSSLLFLVFLFVFYFSHMAHKDRETAKKNLIENICAKENGNISEKDIQGTIEKIVTAYKSYDPLPDTDEIEEMVLELMATNKDMMAIALEGQPPDISACIQELRRTHPLDLTQEPYTWLYEAEPAMEKTLISDVQGDTIVSAEDVEELDDYTRLFDPYETYGDDIPGTSKVGYDDAGYFVASFDGGKTYSRPHGAAIAVDYYIQKYPTIQKILTIFSTYYLGNIKMDENWTETAIPHRPNYKIKEKIVAYVVSHGYKNKDIDGEGIVSLLEDIRKNDPEMKQSLSGPFAQFVSYKEELQHTAKSDDIGLDKNIPNRTCIANFGLFPIENETYALFLFEQNGVRVFAAKKEGENSIPSIYEAEKIATYILEIMEKNAVHTAGDISPFCGGSFKRG